MPRKLSTIYHVFYKSSLRDLSPKYDILQEAVIVAQDLDAAREFLAGLSKSGRGPVEHYQFVPIGKAQRTTADGVLIESMLGV